MKPLGIHYLLELAGCPAPLLNDVKYVRETLLEATRKAEATVISEKFNLFNPHGISGFIVIAESHLSIHTWPELNYAAVDVFTCGHPDLAEKAMLFVREAFKPERFFSYKLRRGIFEEGYEKQYVQPGDNCEMSEGFSSQIEDSRGMLMEMNYC